MYVYSESLFSAHWEKTQMFKIFPSGKIGGTKNALLFLLREKKSSHHSFNLGFLYELMKHKIRISGIVHLCFILLKLKFVFLFNEKYALFFFKTPKSFQN